MSLFRINTNVSALNAQRQLRSSNNLLAEAQERLASGLRINSAADDAAGLAISQKNTTQIKGLQQASTNAQNGISMIQTAEGGLEETQSSLQRMRELAVQASNDTLTKSDRKQIQREVDALSQEIQRISDQTQFNTKNLLDGSLSSDGSLGTQQLQVGANEGQTIEFNISDMGTSENALDVAGAGKQDAEDFVGSGTKVSGGSSKTELTVKGGDGSFTIENEGGVEIGSSADGKVFQIDSSSNIGVDSTAKVRLAAKVDGGQSFTVKANGKVDQQTTKSPTIEGKNANLEAGDYTISKSGSKLSTMSLLNEDGGVVATADSTGKFTGANNVELDFSSQLTSIANQSSGVFADGDTVTIGGPDITDTDSAKSAIETLDSAINAVSSERSELGALQNRLETTISVNNITSENLQAARSRIRDADIAEETVKQTRAQILIQAGTSVLAQANQNPQSALQLLGG